MVLNRILSCTCKWRMRRFGASHTMWLLPWQSVVSVSHLRSLASVRFQKELSPFMRPYWIGFVFDGLFWHFQMEKLENLGKTHGNKRRIKKGQKKYKRIKFGTRILQKKISSISMNHVSHRFTCQKEEEKHRIPCYTVLSNYCEYKYWNGTST